MTERSAEIMDHPTVERSATYAAIDSQVMNRPGLRPVPEEKDRTLGVSANEYSKRAFRMEEKSG